MRRQVFKYRLHFNDKSTLIDDTSLSYNDIKSIFTSDYRKSLSRLLKRKVSKEEAQDISWYLIASADGRVVEHRAEGTEKWMSTDSGRRMLSDIKSQLFS